MAGYNQRGKKLLVLGRIIDTCEDKLICDLAETYGLYNYKELPPLTVATLLIGLRDDSRVKMHLSDSRLTLNQMMMAAILDELRFLSWTKTKHGKRYDQKRILKALQGEYDTKKDELMSFKTVEEYERYMKRFER